MSDAFCRAVRPPTDLQVADWCAENVFIVGSERATKFDIGQFPWWRFPMELIRNHEVQEVFCVMPTGSGKSTMAEALSATSRARNPATCFTHRRRTTKRSFGPSRDCCQHCANADRLSRYGQRTGIAAGRRKSSGRTWQCSLSARI